MPYDYYKVADEVCERLKSAGLESAAQRIKDAIAAGSTGTEILMALRFELNGVLEENTNLGADLKLQIQSLISHINGAVS